MNYSQFEVPINYDELGLKHNDVKATVTTYILDYYPQVQPRKNRPVVIVCPGGGYGYHSPREAEAIAIKMNSLGFHAVVLRYSVAPNEFPCALYEAAWTINYVREHAKDWDADPDRVIIGGFSAGGHVAGCLATMYEDEIMKNYLCNVLKVEPKAVRPDGLLMAYPVVTSGEFAHRGSFEKLLGEQYDSLLEYVSLENRVTKDTPQTFIWHTFADGSVPTENSLLFADSLRKNNVKFDLHIFANGSHGLALASKETDTLDGNKYQPECECWTEMFKNWVDINI